MLLKLYLNYEIEKLIDIIIKWFKNKLIKDKKDSNLPQRIVAAHKQHLFQKDMVTLVFDKCFSKTILNFWNFC